MSSTTCSSTSTFHSSSDEHLQMDRRSIPQVNPRSRAAFGYKLKSNVEDIMASHEITNMQQDEIRHAILAEEQRSVGLNLQLDNLVRMVQQGSDEALGSLGEEARVILCGHRCSTQLDSPVELDERRTQHCSQAECPTPSQSQSVVSVRSEPRSPEIQTHKPQLTQFYQAKIALLQSQLSSTRAELLNCEESFMIAHSDANKWYFEVKRLRQEKFDLQDEVELRRLCEDYGQPYAS